MRCWSARTTPPTLSPWVFRAGEVTQIELGPQVVVMLGGRLQNDEVTLRAYDLSTGDRRPWFGDLARTAQGITTEGETLYVATESEIAAFDLRTGARLPYRGASDGRVLAAGGAPSRPPGGGLRDTVARVGAAAVDLRTNAVLPFDAQVAGAVMHRVPYYEGPWVSAVEKAGDTVYLGGVFATVGGRPQQSLAAVDATTGAAASRFPDRDRVPSERARRQRHDAVRGRRLRRARRQTGDAARRDRPPDRAGPSLGAVAALGLSRHRDGGRRPDAVRGRVRGFARTTWPPAPRCR